MTALEPAVTTADALAAACVRLADAGLSEPKREAEQLYSMALCGPSSAAWLDRGRVLPAALLARLEVAVEQRAAGWPPQYAAGHANFRGHWLTVDRRALIPRPETEGLVELVRAWAMKRAAPPVVADVGTGSGAIAISLALEASVAGLIATDCSDQALALAMHNAAALGVRERISFRRGSMLGPLLGERVDAVVSNPPYVAAHEWDALDPMVRDYEPRLALDGGPDGLGPTRELARQARASIKPGGLIAVEIDARRAKSSTALLAEAGFESVEVRLDLTGRPRYAFGRQPGQT